MQPQSGAATGSVPTILSLLANREGRHAALTLLHERALELTGGTGSILFEYNPANGYLQVTSGVGLDHVQTEHWRPDTHESSLVSHAFASRSVVEVRSLASQMPSLHDRLPTPAALLVPLVADTQRVGLLVVGVPVAKHEAAAAIESSDVPTGLLVALELSRLRQREELEADVRNVIDAFTGQLSTSLELAPALTALCEAANRLFSADRTTVWVHDRDSRTLVPTASSDAAYCATTAAVRADDPEIAAAAGLRIHRAGLAAGESAALSTLTVPLRGCRRALGTLVFEGVRIEPGEDVTLLNRADALGQRLSGTVESTQLLESVCRSRHELEHLFASMAHLIVVVDREGRIVRANQAFGDAVGRDPDSVRQQPFSSCVGEALSLWVAELPTPLPTATSRELTDGVLGGPYLVTATELVGDGGAKTGRVIVARDPVPVSAERAHHASPGRLAQSEKLAALGQFVAGVAHELNNPLQSVLGHLELLRATGAVPEAIRPEIRTVARNADRAARVVRHLLTFAGAGRLQRRRSGVNGIVQRVLALRKASCRERRIEVVRHYDQQLPRILVDPVLLHQVFLNIVMNAEQAIQAAGGSGRIEVTTGLIERSTSVMIEIRDTGTGISGDTLPRLFEPFYTTREVGQGTGLGLALAYGIVQEHGGRIAAKNHPDGGAVFTVELPVA